MIPLDFDLIGSPWATQVLAGTPVAGFTLTNVRAGNVGTF